MSSTAHSPSCHVDIPTYSLTHGNSTIPGVDMATYSHAVIQISMLRIVSPLYYCYGHIITASGHVSVYYGTSLITKDTPSNVIIIDIPLKSENR